MENLIHYILNTLIPFSHFLPDPTPTLYSPKFMPSFKNKVKNNIESHLCCLILRCVAIHCDCFKHCFLFCYFQWVAILNDPWNFAVYVSHVYIYNITRTCIKSENSCVCICTLYVCICTYTNGIKHVMVKSTEVLINEFSICF